MKFRRHNRRRASGGGLARLWCLGRLPTRRDLTPIEQGFAKVKALLHKANARSIEAVDTALGALLDEFEPNEYGRYFTEAGYPST